MRPEQLHLDVRVGPGEGAHDLGDPQPGRERDREPLHPAVDLVHPTYGGVDRAVQGMVDMMRAKDQGLDDGVRRTPQTASPTTFRQCCGDVPAPAVRG